MPAQQDEALSALKEMGRVAGHLLLRVADRALQRPLAASLSFPHFSRPGLLRPDARGHLPLSHVSVPSFYGIYGNPGLIWF